MKEGDSYCGFLCSDIMERQQSILKDIDDFAEYNPGFAQVMRFKVARLCAEAITNNKVLETTIANNQ